MHDEAVGENVGRLKSNLRRHAAAMAALRDMGLSGSTIDRLHLGLKAPYTSRADGVETRDALCFPVLGEGFRPVGRYGYMNLGGVTAGAQAPTTSGPGPPLVYRLGSFAKTATAVVAADVADAWLAWQMSAGTMPDAAFVSRSHAGGWPSEWRSTEFWAAYSDVLLLPGAGCADFLRDIAPRVGRPLSQVELPAPFTTFAAFASSKPSVTLDEALASRREWRELAPMALGTMPDEALGSFSARPVSIMGAFSGGHLYYPVSVERRSLETGRATGKVVHSYQTMVVRSDGHFLSSELLPAPRGTPADRRVLALSDGTRIVAEPLTSICSSWSLPSIERFAAWRAKGGRAPFRPSRELADEIEAVIRSRVWLPDGREHQLTALYVMASHLAQVFDVMPLFAIVGPPLSGRSELAESMARIGFNSTVAGQLRASGMMRLLNETKGLLVIDGMDGQGPMSIFSSAELSQALRTSFRRSTASKPVADRGGRVRLVDFFGPKVVVTSRPVDAISGWRAISVRTDPIPRDVSLPPCRLDDGALDDLRDEIHCWAMASASEVSDAYRSLAAACRTGSDEAASPLRAIATVAGADVLQNLDRTLARPSRAA